MLNQFGYRDARLYERENRSGRYSCKEKDDPDFVGNIHFFVFFVCLTCAQKKEYNRLYEEFLVLSAHFRVKDYIPQKRSVLGGNGTIVTEWMVPAYCGITDAADLEGDTDEVRFKKDRTRFYRDKWLELDGVMNQLAACRYVHICGGRSRAFVKYRTPTGEEFSHDHTTFPVLVPSMPVNEYNPNTGRVETRPVKVPGQGIVASSPTDVVEDPRTQLEYKRLLLAMIYENK